MLFRSVNTTISLTNDIENNINKLIINIDKEEYDVLVERVESLYKSTLLKNLSSNKSAFTSVQISKGIYEAIKHFQVNDKVLFHEMKTKIDDYFLNLKIMNLSDKTIENGSELGNLWHYFLKSFLLLIIGFPIWLFGYINSFIPYKLPRFIALKITDSKAFYGALLMALGTFSFIICYGFITLLAWYFTHSILFTLSYCLALPISGFFTIFYARIARRFYYNWQFTSRFFSKQQLLIQLMSDRNNIIQELEMIKEQFDSKV